MKRRMAVVSAVGVLLMALFALSSVAAVSKYDASIFFSYDASGTTPVTQVKEGDSIFIAVYDEDMNINCDLRDKIWTDVKIMDPKTGAYIVWNSYAKDCTTLHYKGKDGCTTSGEYLEETGANTNLFVSNHPFIIGTRESFTDPRKGTHIVDQPLDTTHPGTFQWGNYEYVYAAGTGTAPSGILKGATVADPNTNPADDRAWFNYELDAILAVTGTGTPTTPPNLPSTTVKAAYGNIVGDTAATVGYLLGRFEKMDTLIGVYQDPYDAGDVAICMAKIVDTIAQIKWDQPFYKDPYGAARITVIDHDQNLDCSRVEYVPVFIIVNPGSWNPVTDDSANDFCMLLHWGGVSAVQSKATVLGRTIRWYNIYNSGLTALTLSPGSPPQPTVDGTYYIQYPVAGSTDWLGKPAVTTFDTINTSGVVRVMFWAKETSVNSGEFQFDLNNLLLDLGFNSLRVGDTLVAYYIDPNDFDDFVLAPTYIGDVERSATSFTDAVRQPKHDFRLGDSVYVQVVDENANLNGCCPEQVVVKICDPHGEDDVEWAILDETTSNSGVFFTNAGMQLRAIWDALGIGLGNKSEPNALGNYQNGMSKTLGYQMQWDNWKIEAFNEDSIYARYNDVQYYMAPPMTQADILHKNSAAQVDMTGLGDINVSTSFPPAIQAVRVANDVSYDLMHIFDSQVADVVTAKPSMYFLNRQGQRVSGYVSSDCVFVEVVDPDQNEDSLRRERVDGYWDGGQNLPFGPQAINEWVCVNQGVQTNPINPLLGSTNPNNDGTLAKLYVLNPRTGRWMVTDIMETGVATADFVSVTCIQLTSLYSCVPSLGALPNDTLIAAYMDPTNHSDSAWISIKLGQGGSGVTPGQGSTTQFTDAAGAAVTQYTDADTVYVTVTDPSHASDPAILGAVKIGTKTYDLAPLAGVTNGFITPAITMSDLGVTAPASITATYTDPMDSTDTSSATVSVVASVLSVTEFYAKPNPFSTSTVFTFKGTGVPTTFSLTILAPGTGEKLWTTTVTGKAEVTWDGKTSDGVVLASGPYVYVAVLTGNNGTLPAFKGTVYIDR